MTTKSNPNSTTTPMPQPSRKGSLRWLLWIACVPLGLLLLILVFISIREYRATLALRTLIANWNQQGEPYDNASMDTWYRKHTFVEGASEWMRITDCVSATSSLGILDRLPIVGLGKQPESLDPKSTWSDEPLVAEYLENMQPILKQIHRATKYPTPIQFPLHFQGLGTLLPDIQESRSIARLVQLDFEHACYRSDSDRAIEDLRAMGYTAKMIDSNQFLVGELVVASLTMMKHDSIRRSLEQDFWDGSKLEEIRNIVGAQRYSTEKWKVVFSNERAMCFDTIHRGTLNLNELTGGTNSMGWLPILPSGTLKFVEHYDSLKALGQQKISHLKAASKTLESNMNRHNSSFNLDGFSTSLFVLLYPAITAYPAAVEREENDRRLTLTTIALRQFKVAEGRFPYRLSDLEKFGLSSEDYSTVNGGMLGYELADNVAYVWSLKYPQEAKVSDVRPQRNVENGLENQYLVTLR